MIKKLLAIILFSLTSHLFAQTQRIEIAGFIKVPKNQNPSGISIYNKNTQRGTTTNYLGQFFIKAKVADTLLITALQFNKIEKIITADIIKDKSVIISLNTYVNDLDEVIIYKKDFSKDFNLSYKALEYEYNFRNDRFSPITKNYAEEAQGLPHLKNGLNIFNLLILAGSAILKKKADNKPVLKIKYQNAVTFLEKNYDTNFYHTTFGIPKSKVSDFIYYIGEIGIDETLFNPKNELNLLAFLQQKATIYKSTLQKE